jgi:hypothetical protein
MELRQLRSEDLFCVGCGFSADDITERPGQLTESHPAARAKDASTAVQRMEFGVALLAPTARHRATPPVRYNGSLAQTRIVGAD